MFRYSLPAHYGQRIRKLKILSFLILCFCKILKSQ